MKRRADKAGQLEAAVQAIVIAGFVDGMDGPAARLLRATSQFGSLPFPFPNPSFAKAVGLAAGAELDSLSDLVCFGFSPAIVLYLWRLHQLGWVGWAVTIIFACCMRKTLSPN